MADSESAAWHRRRFLKGMVVAGGASIAAPAAAQAQAPEKPNGNASPPTAAARANEREHPPEVDRLTTEKSGSDFMVDVCKTLSLDYIASCPGSTFRGLQESFINYGQNKRPEWLTCLHEEVSVGMAHGYAKVAGKPMAAMVHGTVGTQHAAMAIYNAYCDRVPVIIFTGNAGALNERRPVEAHRAVRFDEAQEHIGAFDARQVGIKRRPGSNRAGAAGRQLGGKQASLPRVRLRDRGRKRRQARYAVAEALSEEQQHGDAPKPCKQTPLARAPHRIAHAAECPSERGIEQQRNQHRGPDRYEDQPG